MYRPRPAEELLELFKADCREISEDCVSEGYPSHGSNYELRCEAWWNRMYAEEYEDSLLAEGRN